MAERMFAQGETVAVLTTEPLDRLLDYRAPEGGCGVGDFVEVPLGPRRVLGVVWGPGAGNWDPAKVRPVNRVLEARPMRAELRSFLTRAAEYTLTPWPAMLRLATRAPGLFAAPSARKVYRLSGPVPNQLTDARHRVIEALRAYGGAAVTLSELAEAAGCTTSVVKGLVKLGVLSEEEAPRDLPYPRLHPDGPSRLAGDQVEAGAALVEAVAEERYQAILLKGVTGSGKTEVYLEAVAEAVRRGRQALVLLPEIALTADFLSRVEARFGARPGEWHSGVTQTVRRRLWKMCAEGEVGLVVGGGRVLEGAHGRRSGKKERDFTGPERDRTVP